MDKETFVASWVLDELGRHFPGKPIGQAHKGLARVVIKDALAAAEKAWPGFEAEFATMQACSAVGDAFLAEREEAAHG